MIVRGGNAYHLLEDFREVVRVGKAATVGGFRYVMPLGYHLASLLYALVADVIASRCVHQILHLGMQQAAAHTQLLCNVGNREVGVTDVAINKFHKALDEVAVKLGEAVV